MTLGRDRYLAERVSTASPEQLIKMLFDRMVGELQLAQEGLSTCNRRAAGPHLRKAQAIIAELRCSLDLSVGDVATNLDRLYDYAFTELLEANLDGEVDHVSDVIDVLSPIRDAWSEACCGLQPAS